jgi:hypothetical protein
MDVPAFFTIDEHNLLTATLWRQEVSVCPDVAAVPELDYHGRPHLAVGHPYHTSLMYCKSVSIIL